MRKLEKYTSYKDSGVEWIGEIPEHWEIKKLKFLTKNLNNRRIPIESTIRGRMENRVYDYYGATGVIDKVEDYIYDEPTIVIAEDGANLLLRNIQLVYLADGKYWVNNHAHILRAESINNRYFIANSLENTDYTTLISGSAQPKLTKDNLNNVLLAVPPQEEQEKISLYLESQNKKINKAISQKEKLIELLKEQKQITINEAVTKGLEKDVEFKDSGVEWIGKIPKHWEVIKTKHLFYEKKKTHDISLNCGSISFGKVVEKDDEKIPVSTKASYQVLNKGEFLINPLNLNYDLKSLRIGLSDLDVVVSSGYIIIKNREKMNKVYFNWLLHRYDIAFMKTLGAGVRQTLNYNDIGETLLVNPPIEEQKEISKYIEEQTTRIDKAIELQQNYIAKLKEYKASLIDSVVTGKVKVA